MTTFLDLGYGKPANMDLPTDKPPIIPDTHWHYSFSVPARRMLEETEFEVPFEGTNADMPDYYRNKVNISGVAKFSLAHFNDWVRIPPRVESTVGDDGLAEEIGVQVYPKLANKCTNVILDLEYNGTGKATFTDGSAHKVIAGNEFGSGEKDFPLNTPSLRNDVQSSSPNDITIKATCESDNKKIAEYNFTVCAHPKNFYIEDTGIKHCFEKDGKFGVAVKWTWESDSGVLSDLDDTEIFEDIPKVMGNIHVEQGEFNASTPGDEGVFNKGEFVDGRYIPDVDIPYYKLVGAHASQVGHHLFNCFRENKYYMRLSYDNLYTNISSTNGKYQYILHEHGFCQERCTGQTADWDINLSSLCSSE